MFECIHAVSSYLRNWWKNFCKCLSVCMRPLATFLKEIGLDHAESVVGTDYPDENAIEVIYHLNSYSRVDLNSMVFALSTKTDRDDARLPTLIPIYNSVE